MSNCKNCNTPIQQVESDAFADFCTHCFDDEDVRHNEMKELEFQMQIALSERAKWQARFDSLFARHEQLDQGCFEASCECLEKAEAA